MKKYEITDIVHPYNPKLRRIRALVAIAGTLNEFAAAVNKRHGDSQIAAEYGTAIALCRMRLAKSQEAIKNEAI